MMWQYVNRACVSSDDVYNPLSISKQVKVSTVESWKRSFLCLNCKIFISNCKHVEMLFCTICKEYGNKETVTSYIKGCKNIKKDSVAGM